MSPRQIEHIPVTSGASRISRRAEALDHVVANLHAALARRDGAIAGTACPTFFRDTSLQPLPADRKLGSRSLRLPCPRRMWRNNWR